MGSRRQIRLWHFYKLKNSFTDDVILAVPDYWAKYNDYYNNKYILTVASLRSNDSSIREDLGLATELEMLVYGINKLDYK